MSLDIRAAYLHAAGIAVDLIGQRIVGDKWNDRSALPELAISGLAGHLGRAILQVEWYLDLDEPDPPAISAVDYYAAAGEPPDLHSEASIGVRARANETAAGGWARLYLDVTRTLDRLSDRLPGVLPERRIVAIGSPLVIDEYLKTRLVELTVHTDDLARSLELPSPTFADDVIDEVVNVLVGAARVTHGDMAVLHALTRRELDEVNALRVL